MPQPSRLPDGHAAVGRVVGAWGLQGHLKVDVETDFPDRFAPGKSLYLLGVLREIVDVRERKAQLLVKLAGVHSPEDARSLTGALLTVPESELNPLREDQYFRHQLVGLRVNNTAGENRGQIAELLDAGSTQVLVVRDVDGKELLVPFVDEFVSSVDLATGELVIDEAALSA